LKPEIKKKKEEERSGISLKINLNSLQKKYFYIEERTIVPLQCPLR
jgi:hypothetical protein